jgi:hypothetical protein
MWILDDSFYAGANGLFIYQKIGGDVLELEVNTQARDFRVSSFQSRRPYLIHN